MTFPAASFELETVQQLSVAALRVKFTQYPRALDASQPDDALNPDNYSLAGPSQNYVIGCSTVDGDRQSIDVYLAAPLVPGGWHLSVANIVEDTSEALMPPTTLDFLVTSTVISAPLSGGAINDEYENILRKFLNPALKGRGWDSMIAALATADQKNADNARLAFDQLFLTTASGVYLDRRASDEGINRPKGVNMSDDLFRKLALAQRNGKLTQKSILDVLEVFYGRDATRASSDTAAAETYILQDGDQLVILFEERNTVTVTFERSHFSRIGMATAEEVAAAITRACRDAGNEGFAVSFADTTTGQNKVRIYSGTLGLTSSVRIVGGRANVVLLFPTSLFTQTGSSPFATWDITFSPTTQGNLRFTMTAGTEYDLFQVQEGDLAYIYGTEFGVANINGTYTIEALSVTHTTKWFEIKNPLGQQAAGVIQTQFADLTFFRPKRKTIYDNSRRVIVGENRNWLDIIIPATTEVVDRGPGLAAYLNVNPALSIASLVRLPSGIVTVGTSTPHGLSEGDQVFIDGVIPSGSGPSNIAGVSSGDWGAPNDTESGITDASPASTCSMTGTYESTYSKALVLQTGDVMVIGGEFQPGPTVNPNMTIFQKTDETLRANGGYQQTYKWTQIANDSEHGFGGTNFGQRYFSACVLADGDVLAAGGGFGDDITGTPYNGWSRFTFLPPNNVLQQIANNMPAAVMSAAMAPAPNGNAVLCGGWTVSGTARNSTWVFNAGANTWTTHATMRVGRIHHQFTTLNTGLMLASGGYDFTNPLASCELYDPIGDTWAMTGNMTFARYGHAIVTLPDGRVIAIGGTGYNPSAGGAPTALASCEIYDPHTGIWLKLPSMSVARDNPVVGYSPLRNCVMVAGGTGVTKIEYLNLSTMKWVTAPVSLGAAHANSTGCVTSHSNLSGTPIHQDTFLICGGDTGGSTEKKNFVFLLGADNFLGGVGLNRNTSVDSVIDATHFTYDTGDICTPSLYTSATTGKVTPEKANPAPATVPGPFSYDTKEGVAITATAAVTDTVFNEGSHYPALHLEGTNTALNFPDEEGWLVFNFGFENQVGPVRYLGRLTTTDLALDVSVPFSKTLPAGATVRLLSGRNPFEPAVDKLVGNFYVTGTAAGRAAATQIIDDITAAGKQVLVTVIYPGDRGLGAEGFPDTDSYKLTDAVSVWGGDELDTEIPALRAGQ